MNESSAVPEGYPAEWEADVVLRDGSVARIRPVVPDDAVRLQRFHAAQSERSIYLRFFAAMPRLSDRDAARFAQIDYVQRVALVMTIGSEIIGIGRYDRLDGPTDTTAEVAFNVSDHHHGRGIGSVLLEHLADIGRDSGVRRFVADTLPQNRKMIAVFADAGYEVSHEFDDGLISVSFDIEPTDNFHAVLLAREHRSESMSVSRVLKPSTVAVVGVSRTRRSLGRAIYRHLKDSGFTGTVLAVNNAAAAPADDGGDEAPAVLARVSDAEVTVDMVVIAVPAEQVIDVVRDAAVAGATSVVVTSTGFAESGPEGKRRQEHLLRVARDLGLRVLGPSSFGLINNDPSVRLNASIAPRLPPSGALGLFAQSGALGIAVLADAERRGLGISTFASAGNRVDISGNDLMQYWTDDEATRAVGLYLESVGNPRKFSRIARQLAMTKPVIVIKSDARAGTVPAGHQVRLTRERPEAFGALLRQAGVIRVSNIHQLFDVAQLAVHQPLPQGSGVGIITNSDALGVLAADACHAWELDVTHGPVTLDPYAGPTDFAEAMRSVLSDPTVDSLVVSFIPPVERDDTEAIRAVARVAREFDKPCVATFVGLRGVASRDLPTYPMPEDAVRALAAITRYAGWRDREQGEPARPSRLDKARARSIVQGVLRESPSGRTLEDTEARDLLASYGIEVWPAPEVDSADEAVRVASEIGYPVVVKGNSPVVRHRPAQPWIRTSLQDAEQVAIAFADLADGLAALDVSGVVIQKMAPTGTVVEVASTEDPLFGPVVAFGIAGAPVELLGDVAHRFPPLTDQDIAEMVASLRAAPMLDGYRGSAPADLQSLYDLLARVGMLADDRPELLSVRLNPVICHERGVAVLGAEIEVAPAPTRTDRGRRALNR